MCSTHDTLLLVFVERRSRRRRWYSSLRVHCQIVYCGCEQPITACLQSDCEDVVVCGGVDGDVFGETT